MKYIRILYLFLMSFYFCYAVAQSEPVKTTSLANQAKAEINSVPIDLLNELDAVKILLYNSLREVKAENQSDNFTIDDINKYFDEAIKLCEELEKDISWFSRFFTFCQTHTVKLFSRCRRRPIDTNRLTFDTNLLAQVRDLKKSLLQYKATNGRSGNGISKEKFINLIAIIKTYKRSKQDLADKAKASICNWCGRCGMSILMLPFNAVYLRISKILGLFVSKLSNIAVTISCYLLIAGIINGTFVTDKSFLAGFVAPSHEAWKLVISFLQYWLSGDTVTKNFGKLTEDLCKDQSGFGAYACPVVKWTTEALDFIATLLPRWLKPSWA